MIVKCRLSNNDFWPPELKNEWATLFFNTFHNSQQNNTTTVI
jgi:hypothetical protein